MFVQPNGKASVTTGSVRPQRGRLPLWAGFVLLWALAACAPQLEGPGRTSATGELERTAQMAYHRMEIVFLETGSYTTNALIDLELPRGVKWTLEEFSDETYRLRFTDDNRPGVIWSVSPAGVMPVTGTAGD